MTATLSLGSSILFLLVIFASSECLQEDDKYLKFPSNFLFGAATAAYQVEGAWNVSDKGPSVWDTFAHQSGHIYNNETGDVAADSYHKYKEDVALVKSLGFKSYRFSISWPRILPTGFANNVSRDGVQYYNNLLDELKKNNIEPLVTLYHWDHPQSIEDAGGWLSFEMVDWFGDYARVVYREFGTKVKKFIPINEPMSFCKDGYSSGRNAPGKQLHGINEYLCMHNAIKAHARAYRIYENEFKESQKGEVGFMISSWAYMPKTPADQYYANVSFAFNIGWSMDPIFYGDYPVLMKNLVADKSKQQGFPRSRLPTFDVEWSKYIKGTYDFLAVNHYTGRLVSNGTMGKVPSYENDQGVVETIDPMWKKSASSWLMVVPEGFRYVLRQLAQNYGNPRMYITENGFSDRGTLTDDDRIDYFREYLRQMLRAMYDDNANVQGYLLWSLLDNFEWASGYSEHFGIVQVDYKDPKRPRILKKSAEWWKSVVASGKLDK